MNRWMVSIGNHFSYLQSTYFNLEITFTLTSWNATSNLYNIQDWMSALDSLWDPSTCLPLLLIMIPGSPIITSPSDVPSQSSFTITTIVRPHSGILLGQKKEWSPSAWYDVYEAGKCHAEWKKTVTKDLILYDSS